MWNCLRDFPHCCTIFHFIDRTAFYAITNRFVQLAVRHAYPENLWSLVGTSLQVSDDGKWPPGLSAKLLHTALRILQQNNEVRRMTRTGNRGTPEKLNLCKAGRQLPNTCILLDNKSYRFLPGEKTWKSTLRKLLSVTLCHVLSTALRSKFLRILLLYLDQVQAGLPTPLSWNMCNYFCLKQRTPVCVTIHVRYFFYRHTEHGSLSHRNLHQFGYPVTTAMFKSATKQTHCTLFISNMTPHAVNSLSVPFLATIKLIKFS